MWLSCHTRRETLSSPKLCVQACSRELNSPALAPSEVTEHHSRVRATNGACAHYVMVSKFQWMPFWLATQRDPQNDWTATQNRVNYDVFAQAPSLCPLIVAIVTQAFALIPVGVVWFKRRLGLEYTSPGLQGFTESVTIFRFTSHDGRARWADQRWYEIG